MSLFSANSFSVLGALFCIALTGCGEPPEPAGDLAGKVFSNDEPVGECVLSLFSDETKRTIGGRAGAEGQFIIKGIPLGNFKIAVMQAPSNDAIAPPFDRRIPAKYRNRNTSGFSVDILQGKNSVELRMDR